MSNKEVKASPEVVGESPVAKQSVDGGISTSSVPLDTSRVTYRDRLTGVSPNLDSWEDWSIGDDEEDVFFDDSISDTEEAAAANVGPSVSSQAPSHVEGSFDVGFGPWMIVQRKGRRPVKDSQGKDKAKADSEGSDSRIRSNAMIGATRDSRNRYNPLNGAPLDSGDKAKEPLPKVVNKSFKEVKSAAKPEWIPKKREVLKLVPSLWTRASSSFKPTSRVDPPPGFCFKAGSSKPIIFYPKKLAVFIDTSSSVALPKEVISVGVVNSQTPTTVENPSGEAVKSLTTDPLSLPQQHPPSSLGLQYNGDSDMVVDKDDNLSKEELVVEPSRSALQALTAVYASPTPSVCDFLWNYLNEFDEFDNIPWLLLGDFNQVLTAEEKSGGRPGPVRRMESFQEVIDRRHLIDLEASGCKFTWSNKQPPGI
ncbi:Endonuclease/exonuclease/phosphatase [Corchorus olitorius]|uniref:Endonuclease/exonuclease/phosphatase n=1 Tax=Corchorus olitorius TaxID=93759 RepID=A0A1R3J2Y6_9ROSI|nr:Endonuclease/exonuclease/phosphatase [Corchorus olitorius]